MSLILLKESVLHLFLYFISFLVLNIAPPHVLQSYLKFKKWFLRFCISLSNCIHIFKTLKVVFFPPTICSFINISNNKIFLAKYECRLKHKSYFLHPHRYFYEISIQILLLNRFISIVLSNKACEELHENRKCKAF